MYPKNQCSETPSPISSTVFFLNVRSISEGTDQGVIREIGPHGPLAILVGRRPRVVGRNKGKRWLKIPPEATGISVENLPVSCRQSVAFMLWAGRPVVGEIAVGWQQAAGRKIGRSWFRVTCHVGWPAAAAPPAH